ncbi:syntaxin-12 isoform X1 [Strongylocentrotus purpuratus]|uniref:t-SNARE coiled-coil homology domain-containing protein n=1 Tax=Strongylocentrotus purpuratus TaxID=7668 RepID=A0A7M7HL96_STRPU|nr:syntaxin-12 isoform X1 [Strongylocentrotus purpuratus]|eukprot:XP_011670466.1 PREDICTED: syntaxin-12 isoform X3 [Strongylocentrotus purpuratus]
MEGRGEFGYGSTGARSDQGGGPGDFATLMNMCSSSIFKINSSISLLEKAIRQIGTPSDNNILRGKIQQMLTQTNTAISQTKQCMSQLGHAAKTLEKQKKIQFERIANDFHDTVQRYGSVQKRVANKMRSSPSVRPQSQSQGTMGFGEQGNDYDQKTPLLSEEEEEKRRQMQIQMQQQDSAIDYDLTLIQEREEQIRQIEATMLDVNEIFKDLSMMVSEQGDMIDSIEANVDRAGDNVEEGGKQLATASKYQKKARKKMCCIFGILAVCAVALTLILVFTLR